jgi:hypothetical protein
VHCAADGDDAGARPEGAAEQVGEQERPEMVDAEVDFKRSTVEPFSMPIPALLIKASIVRPRCSSCVAACRTLSSDARSTSSSSADPPLAMMASTTGTVRS